MTESQDVRVGDHVQITLLVNPARQSTGRVFRVLSLNATNVVVVLTNGDKGKVIRVINSEDVIKERIMTEGQYAENKENFSKDVMRNDVIPKTVQAFLNSEGGHLYIGVRDVGRLGERLVGLDYDFKIIDPDQKMTTDKKCDTLERQIMDSLAKHLESDESIGPLVKFRFVQIRDVLILEIAIKQSSKPWFYKHLTRSNRRQEFEIYVGGNRVGKRTLDDVYIRSGSSKKALETHKDFYDYVKHHFT